MSGAGASSGGPRVTGDGLRERWVRGDRAWVYGGDRALALRVHEARGELASLSAAGEVLRWDAETGALRSKRALELDLQDGARSRRTDVGRREPCDAGAFDAGADRVVLLVGDSPAKLWVFDAHEGRRLAACAAAPARVSDARYWFNKHTRIEGFSMDGGSVLGALRGTNPDATGGHRWAAVLWHATTGEVLDQWELAAAPLWNARRDSILFIGRDGGLRSKPAQDLWTGDEWGVELPALIDGALLLSGDGSVLVAHGLSWPPGSVEHLVAVDTRTGEVRWRAERPVRARRGVGATSIDGSLLLFETDGIEAFEMATGEPCALPTDCHEMMRLASSPRAHSPLRARHFAASDGVVRRFFPGSVEDVSEAAELVGAVSNVALSRSGARALTMNHARTLRVWDARAGDPLQRLETEGDPLLPCGVAMSPDERTAFAMKAGRLVRWSLESGVCAGESALVTTASAVGPRAPGGASPLVVRLAAVSPDGSQLVALRETSEAYALVAFDAHTGQQRWNAYVKSNAAPTVQYALDGARPLVLVGVGKQALIDTLDVNTGRKVGESPDLVDFEGLAAAVFPTDDHRGWCVVDGYLREFNGMTISPRPVAAMRVAAPYARSSDGRWLVTASLTGDALVWRLREGSDASCVAQLELASDFDSVASADFDARGETLLVGTERGLLLCYELREEDESRG